MAKKRKPNSAQVITLLIILFALFKVYVLPNMNIPENNTTLDVQQTEKVSQNDNNFQNSDKPKEPTTPIPSIPEENLLKIHYIDVGQADCILITLNDQTMLIDAGDEAHDDDVVNYLKAQNITEFDYVIGTHPHADHIGGLDSVINEFAIDTLLMPKAVNTSPSFESVLDAMEHKNLSATSPKIGDTYSFNAAEFTILNSVDSTPENLNNASIVIRLVYGEQSYLFTGDAEKAIEYQMMDSGLTLKSNVLKVAHHGSNTSSLEKFILAVDPDIAVISVGKDNSYGHPHEKIVNRLNRLNIKTYRTDENGTIIISSDGKFNYVTVEKEG
ncbi:MAG: MBL fold metallo-hydrolase [Clostridia bacterium]|nr:MBL fold metallo-hydrolase [Clostridia bacterium]